ELATPCTPCKCATGLRYVPNNWVGKGKILSVIRKADYWADFDLLAVSFFLFFQQSFECTFYLFSRTFFSGIRLADGLCCVLVAKNLILYIFFYITDHLVFYRSNGILYPLFGAINFCLRKILCL